MLNAKVRCIKGGSELTEGKIYEVKNGYLYGDNRYVTSIQFKSLQDLNYRFYPQFELFEEELPQPHKSMLKDGDYVVDREGTKMIVSLKFEKLFKNGNFMYLNGYLDDLTFKLKDYNKYDIFEIWRDDELIAKRTEKPKTVSINVQLKSNLTESDIDEIIDSIKKKCLEKIEITFI